MLIYVHVPFCVSKCVYCAFHSRVPGEGDVTRYVGLLHKEIDHWARELGRVPVESVYFGGGTPSMLPPGLLGPVVRKLRTAFDFQDGFEFTFEANPQSGGVRDYLRALAGMGVNRLSLGVQSLDDVMLRALGRPHTATDAINAFYDARQAGFRNINLDFIWGLPGQRLKQWLEDLKRVVGLRSEHLSCYGLTVEAGTPLEEMCMTRDMDFAADADLSRMFVYGAEFLEESGFLQYEISNFAKMGFMSRHNLGYWEGAEYLGLGPSAVSTMGGRRWSVPAGMDAYAAAVKEGRLGEGAEELGFAERVKELVMLRLRTARGLSLKEFRALTGGNLVKDNEPLMAALRQNELIRISQGHLRLTKTGMVVSDTILARLFEALERKGALEGGARSIEADGAPGAGVPA
ncbi:MAG: radical SAM family heme chaperone HemW [Desulfovibrionaceae bacterium]|nr:radical SAM family heme chaperone HemW [Desulfovibrionaceae bacterium]